MDDLKINVTKLGVYHHTSEGQCDKLRQILCGGSATIQLEPQVLIQTLINFETSEGHRNCLYLLLDNMESGKVHLSNINAKDANHKTPLYYSLRHASDDVSLRLMKCGARLDDGQTLKFLTPQLLKMHLDGLVNFENRGDTMRAITFDHDHLIGEKRSVKLLGYMLAKTDFHHLLSHPVIVSFVALKWDQIYWIRRIQNILHSVYLTCALLYTLLLKPGLYIEMILSCLTVFFYCPIMVCNFGQILPYILPTVLVIITHSDGTADGSTYFHFLVGCALACAIMSLFPMKIVSKYKKLLGDVYIYFSAGLFGFFLVVIVLLYTSIDKHKPEDQIEWNIWTFIAVMVEHEMLLHYYDVFFSNIRTEFEAILIVAAVLITAIFLGLSAVSVSQVLKEDHHDCKAKLETVLFLEKFRLVWNNRRRKVELLEKITCSSCCLLRVLCFRRTRRRHPTLNCETASNILQEIASKRYNKLYNFKHFRIKISVTKN